MRHEVELEMQDVEQMIEAQNAYRRKRGEREITEDEFGGRRPRRGSGESLRAVPRVDELGLGRFEGVRRPRRRPLDRHIEKLADRGRDPPR